MLTGYMSEPIVETRILHEGLSRNMVCARMWPVSYVLTNSDDAVIQKA